MPDQLLPQPPPDAPAPLASEAALRSRRKFWWMIGIGLISVVLILWVQSSFVVRHRGKSDWIEVLNNARQVGMALFEFEAEYGKFPDTSTSAVVQGKSGTIHTLSDRTSNDLFAQLFASGFVSSELMFYAKAKSARMSDGIFDSDLTLLEHGECGFAYISGLSKNGNPKTPLIFGPVVPGTTKFDLITCHGKAVVLTIDNSVTSLPINSSGKIIHNGLDLLDPRQPFWHGKTPDVKWPK